MVEPRQIIHYGSSLAFLSRRKEKTSGETPGKQTRLLLSFLLTTGLCVTKAIAGGEEMKAKQKRSEEKVREDEDSITHETRPGRPRSRFAT